MHVCLHADMCLCEIVFTYSSVWKSQCTQLRMYECGNLLGVSLCESMYICLCRTHSPCAYSCVCMQSCVCLWEQLCLCARICVCLCVLTAVKSPEYSCVSLCVCSCVHVCESLVCIQLCVRVCSMKSTVVVAHVWFCVLVVCAAHMSAVRLRLQGI